MLLDSFQLSCGSPPDKSDDLIILLDLGAHAGRLLRTHSQYLSDSIDHAASNSLIKRELGDILCGLAALCQSNALTLSQVAASNLEKIYQLFTPKDDQPPYEKTSPLSGTQYQNLASATDQQAVDGIDPLGLSVPLLGLAGEIGTLYVAQKKLYRDHSPQASNRAFLNEELGDILWYTSAVATHSGLSLDEVLVEGNARAAAHREELTALAELPNDLVVLDASYPNLEQFPRTFTIRVQQRAAAHGQMSVGLSLVSASPNYFPDGPITYAATGKDQGFSISQSMGDNLTDNSRRIDNYRFHDAIHLGLVAVLGWSPLMRSLFKLKRRSDPTADDAEDGARAIFAEEGIAAVLAKRATMHQGFLTETSVDDETIEMITTVVEDLEVNQLPPWLWKRAIAQGFRAMQALAAGPGGFLVADLDKRTLTYRKTPPTP